MILVTVVLERINPADEFMDEGSFCQRCAEWKLLLEFNLNRSKPDGLSSWCKVCMRAYDRQRYRRDTPTALARSRKHWEMNADYHSDYKYRWHAAAQVGDDSQIEAGWREEQLARQDSVCCYCLENASLELEHSVPISRGDNNDLDNIALACRSCNASKNDRTIEEWISDLPSGAMVARLTLAVAQRQLKACLTEADVKQIRLSSVTQRELANICNCSAGMIGDIKRRETYKWVD